VAAVAGLAEGQRWTAWTAGVTLQENEAYYWRARAADGISFSAWTAVASFRVDVTNEAPAVPAADSPAAGARVATSSPQLVVTSAADPEGDGVRYDFQLATDSSLSQVVASANGVAEGAGVSAWTVPIALRENATYYWTARATDGRASSSWFAPAAFVVDTGNQAPSAPVPTTPVGGVLVPTTRPLLVAGSAQDPEGGTVTYVFEIDRLPTFDSPALQVSPPVADGASQVSWTVATPLLENTAYHWRVAASDGRSQGGWTAPARFVVSLANDAPGTPVLLDPVDGQGVATATPSLRLRNAADADGDPLAYEIVVTDVAGAVVASATLPESPLETAWTVPIVLAESGSYQWRARASDGQALGPWTEAQGFRVLATAAAPGTPARVAPEEDAGVDTRHPTHVVANAAANGGGVLAYVFELYRESAGAVPVLTERSGTLAEGVSQTEWLPSSELADDRYAWTARAESSSAGPWMRTARFRIAVDAPPAPPGGLHATPGDGRVSLAWDVSPEPGIVQYRVYRGFQRGGPWELVGTAATPAFEDTGLANGVTLYYAVTARDSRFESARSVEAGATPQEPPVALVPLEVRLRPAVVNGTCVACPTSSSCDDDRDDDETGDHADTRCPRWLYATLEPASIVPASAIPVESVRLAGSVAADRAYRVVVDEDRDGKNELKVRFAWSAASRVAHVGVNTLAVTARAQGRDLRGDGTLTVEPARVAIVFTPRVLDKSRHGQEVEVQLTLPCRLRARDLDLASVRLNETVPVRRVTSSSERKIHLKFDRAAVAAILPVGANVEIRLTGTVKGFPFLGRDTIKVTK